jgi:hypothetical protein
VLQWNASSILTPGKLDELKLVAEDTGMDILLISETNLSPEKRVHLPGYLNYRHDRNRRGGGVAIFVRECVKHTLLPPLDLPGVEAVAIKLHLNRHDIVVVSTYAPLGSLTAECIRKCLGLGSKVIFAGDLNARHRTWNCSTANTNGNVLLKYIEKHANTTVYFPDSPTFYRRGCIPSTLDIAVLKGMGDLVSRPCTLFRLQSDHWPVTFSIGAELTLCSRKQYNYAKADWKGYGHYISRALQGRDHAPQSIEEIDKAVHTLTTAISEGRAKYVPLRTQSRYRPPPQKVLDLITTRNSHRRRYDRLGLPEDKVIVNRLQKEIRSLLQQHKDDLWQSRLARVTPEDHTALWGIVRSLKTRSDFIPPLRRATGVATSDGEKAEALADAYVHTYETTSGMRHAATDRLVSDAVATLAVERPSPQEIPLVTPGEVSRILRGLKNSKAPGIDNLHPCTLKRVPLRGVIFMVKIFNACLIRGYYPAGWKTGRVVPIHKPGKDPTLPVSYRPISLLPILGKVFEKTINTRLLAHHTANNTLQPEQFGFRKQHSTTQQLIRLTEHITRGFNVRSFTAMALLDLAKAFDTVWHDGLLYKLINTNTPTYLTLILQSYLTDRHFVSAVRNEQSAPRPIPMGVPQGSILGPVLFNLFTHDIPSFPNTQLALYADDAAIFTTSLAYRQVGRYLQPALDGLADYYRMWRLKVNESKTEAIVFSHRPNSPPPIRMGREPIQWRKEVKYLGVTMDSRLTWGPHIDRVTTKARAGLFALYPLLNRQCSLTVGTKLKLYHQLIRPIITYAAPVWHSTADSHHLTAQRIQNRALRTIYNTEPRQNLTRLHNTHGLDTLLEHCTKLTESFYNSIHDHTNTLISELGKYTLDDLPTRYKYKLPRHRFIT